MAITTVDGALAGMQPPRFFSKGVTATLVAGRPASLWALGVAPSLVEVTADVDAVVMGDRLSVTVRIAPPTSLTDTVQEHDQYLVFEPGLATSERRIWEGKWTVTAAPEAV